MNLISAINSGPSFSFFNKVDGGWIYISNDRQRVCWNSKAQGFANVDHLSLRKFMSGLFFPSQINQPSIPCVFAVLRQGNPLKIFWSVVRLDAVDVVDGKVGFVSVYKTHCNQAVNKNFRSFPVLQCRHHQISILTQKWRKFDRWEMACKNLFNAVSDAFCRAASSLIPYASVWVNKPRSAFFNNFYWFHGVKTIAGHLYKCKPA